MIEKRKIRAYSVVSDPFRFGFLIMARTVIRMNPDYEITFRVIHHPDICPLSPQVRQWLQTHIVNVEFDEVSLEGYENIFRLRDEVFRTPKRLWAAFLILEAFRDGSDEHHVICLDSDMICLAPFDSELLRDQGFAAVEARSGDGEPRGFFNTGVMAIGPDARGPEAYAKVMATDDTDNFHPSSGRADQALLSLIYSPKNAISLPWRYNVTKRHVPDRGVEAHLKGMNAVFYHYVGAKPWHVSLDVRDRHDDESVALWDRVVTEHLNQEELIEYYEEWRDRSRELARAHMDELLAPPLPRTIFPTKKIKRILKPFVRPVWRAWRKARGTSSSGSD